MYTKSTISGSLFISLLFCWVFSIQAQTIKWQDHPDETFIYEISNKEAEKLLKSEPKDSLILKMLHTPAGSFKGKWENRPEQGHFIFASISKNRVNYSYTPVMPFQVFLFKEYGILTLQVVDAEGNIRDDAKVKIKGRWKLFDTGIYFDKTSHTYTIDDWSEKSNRLLTVELDKFTAIFNLSKHFVDPWYGGRDYSDDGPDFYSYMITDKNKYKPGETVRFKSYALSNKKKPLKKDLEVWMRTGKSYYNYKKIKMVSSYHPGGYAGEIELHDSLKLKLDDYYGYGIQLRDDKGRIVANTSFKYEDYELYDSRLETKIKNYSHFYPDTNYLEIKAVDANGLILQDMRAEISIMRNHVSESFTDILVIPDTLLYKKIELDNNTPTVVNIPPDLFGKSNCSYNIYVKAYTYDNQILNSGNSAQFYSSYYDIPTFTRNDTVCFKYNELGIEKSISAELSYNNTEEVKKITLPYEEPFKQSLNGYRIRIPENGYSKYINTTNIGSHLDIKGGISTDSFNIELKNPLNLEVSWYIYKGNELLEKGSGTEFDFKYPNTDLELTHYVEIFYFMGTVEQSYRRTFIPKTEFLDVNIDLPERIYPGQTLDATITVKDHMGRPVKDADLTAFAVNSQLNYHIPDLPYYGSMPRTREERSSYTINKRYHSFNVPLNYEYWNERAQLDKMKYYQFTYPHDTIFKHVVNTPDSITQFAPFVMKDGKAVKIYVIENNGCPIYFSWTEQPKGYSFAVSDTAKSQITLRLYDCAIILHPMTFEQGKKTIISVDLDHLPASAKKLKIDTKDKYGDYHFTSKEINTYKRYISRIPVKPDNEFTYLRQGSKIYPIYHKCLQYRNLSNIQVGPIPEGRIWYINDIEYKHEGGFSYQYEENVVYKYPSDVLPDRLTFSSDNNFGYLNDFYLSLKVFNEAIEKCKIETKDWHPGAIQISQNRLNLKFLLPIEKDSTGVSNLLFKNHETGRLIYPDKFSNSSRVYSNIPEGTFDVILLYNNGKYIRFDSIPFRINAYTQIDMRKLSVHEKTAESKKWLLLRTRSLENNAPRSYNTSYNSTIGQTTTLYARPSMFRRTGNTVTGYVYDNSKEPLIGVTVQLKGTTYGAVTDIDGHFEIDVDSHNQTLVFSYIGYESKTLDVTPGSEIEVILEESAQHLDEVVVVGYGTMSKRSLTGSMMSIRADKSESQPQAKPESIEEDEKSDETVTQDAEDKLYSELLLLNGLRSNFSDVGFWEPRLYTDKKGKAKFSVTFPDNITQWNTIVYAMNRKLKTGTARKYIKSYKPLMAELKNPQFLVVGDSSYYAGNIRNYTKDKDINGNIMFAVGEDTLMNRQIDFTSSHQDKILVTATNTDSLTTTYLFTRNDGYNDGEKRTIPIQPQGTLTAEGSLQFLRNGDKLDATANQNEDLHITITGKQLDVYMDATYYLTGYEYACNEQLASKLIGLLNYKIYQEFMGEKFKHDKNINEIIKRLTDNQNGDRYWSWWGRSSSTSYWMSAHVMKALYMARKAGYNVNVRPIKVEQDYVDTKSFRYTSWYDIDMLNILSEQGVVQDYKAAIDMFDERIKNYEARDDSIAKARKSKRYNSYLREKLQLLELRQRANIGYTPDSLTKYFKKDILGGIYCDDGIERFWYSDNLITTLIAYRIVKNDSTLQHLKEPIQMYILGTKRNGWNTYQAASAISDVLPDLIAESATKDKPATVLLSGKENRELTKFPYETVLRSGEQLNIEKKDGMPLIYSAYNIKRITEKKTSDAFEISSYMNAGDTITAGVPVTLTVEVKVKQKNAEYVMIEIPIPAGCSYASKADNRYGYGYYEVHRESFKEKTVIFCESLPEGKYYFNIYLLPRYTGRYTLNPAKAELMYFPVINANNDIRKVEIQEREE